jgi:hypothetical protein
MELAASFGYRIIGEEHLVIPRLQSVVFWLIGGFFLYLIAKKLASVEAAVVSTAFYLLLPYGVAASRSFQPDPLMVMMLLISILAILRLHERPSGIRLGVAASISSLAVLVKPVCFFLVVGAYFSMAIYRQGVRKTITSTHSVLFVVASLALAGVFYGYGIFVAGFLRSQAEESVLPQLLSQPIFWAGWLVQIREVIGITYFVGGLFGVLMVREGLLRALLIGLWCSYFVFGLVFTYHVHTHDYYHLQLIPLVALSLGPVGVQIAKNVSQVALELHTREAVLGILLLAAVVSLLTIPLGVHQAEERTLTGLGGSVGTYEEIGEVVDHSPSTLYWASDYGKPLKYHGWLSGTEWPRRGDIELEDLMGAGQISVEERFDALHAEVSPEYFIVVPDAEWLEEQKDLRDFLAETFPVTGEGDNYIVFDLRKRNETQIGSSG